MFWSGQWKYPSFLVEYCVKERAYYPFLPSRFRVDSWQSHLYIELNKDSTHRLLSCFKENTNGTESHCGIESQTHTMGEGTRQR